MIVRFLTYLALIVPLIAVTATGSMAAAPKLIGSYRDWDAFMLNSPDGKTCYVRTAPTKSEPTNVRRGDIFLFVTHREAGKVYNEVSVLTGYPYKTGSSVSAMIGNQKFTLFTEGDGAWLEKATDETRMVTAMKKGANMTVIGTSQRGTRTTDRYSLRGFTNAHQAASKACNYR